jgi:excisionase family DNA binding protein
VDEFVTMGKAQELLGVSKFTVWQMVKDGRLTAYQLPTDRRHKYIRIDEIQAMKQLRPIKRPDSKASA